MRPTQSPRSPRSPRRLAAFPRRVRRQRALPWRLRAPAAWARSVAAASPTRRPRSRARRRRARRSRERSCAPVEPGCTARKGRIDDRCLCRLGVRSGDGLLGSVGWRHDRAAHERRQRLRELAGGRIAIGRLARDRAAHDGIDRRRGARDSPAWEGPAPRATPGPSARSAISSGRPGDRSASHRG